VDTTVNTTVDTTQLTSCTPAASTHGDSKLQGRESSSGNAPQSAADASRSLCRKVSDDSEDEQAGWAGKQPPTS